MSTDIGAPAPSDAFSLSVGTNNPILLHDHHFIAQMAHFNRERVPERNVHAKGGGAFGRFEVTDDVSQYTKARCSRPAPPPGRCFVCPLWPVSRARPTRHQRLLTRASRHHNASPPRVRWGGPVFYLVGVPGATDRRSVGALRHVCRRRRCRVVRA